MEKISVGIVGASGYSGEVLVELLSRHPRVAQLVVASRSNVGERVADLMPRLRGTVGELRFVESAPEQLAGLGLAVWFLALPHGVAAEYAGALERGGATVIDLSADFRLGSVALYERWYGAVHAMGERLGQVPYVLPELAGDAWKRSGLIACPGCYPTSILLPLLPLARAGTVALEGVVINAVSGISGAGKKATAYYSYCERNASVVGYGLGGHRHVSEIEEQLSLAAGKPVCVQFTPHLVPMPRGIASTIVIPGAAAAEAAVYAQWRAVYGHAPCVEIVPAGMGAETGNVVGRNRIEMSATADKRTGNLVLTAAIDNLMKGASGQAVQIFNLRFGFGEMEGLS